MTVAEPNTMGQRLALLLECAGKMPADVIDDLVLDDLTSLEDIIADRRAASPDEVVLLAAYLDVPIGVLTGRIPAGGSSALAMRLGRTDAPSDVRGPLAYAHAMLRIQQLLRSWFPDTENAQLKQIGKVRSRATYAKQAGKTTAERLRFILKLGEEPISDLTEVVEGLGIPVAHRPMAVNCNLTGLTVPNHVDKRQRWGIVVNSNDNWLRQRYTLAHELCHVLYDDSDEVIVERAEIGEREPEWRADSFARYLLVPEQTLSKLCKSGNYDTINGDVHLISDAMMLFGASRQVVLKALVDDGIFSQTLADSWINMPVKELMSTAGRLDWWEQILEHESYMEPSPMLLDLALDAYRQGLIDVRVVAELLEGDTEAVRTDLARRGWAPVGRP